MAGQQESIELPSGHRMPLLGFGTSPTGTFKADQDEITRSVEAALDAGYRHIDAAFLYRSEKAVGQALHNQLDSGKVKREDLFVTSKLLPGMMDSKENILKGLQQSLDDLQVDYLDLYLIHFPVPFKMPDPKNPGVQLAYYDLVAAWKWLEELVDEGKVRSIGVSNFNSQQIERLHKAARIPVSNNQIELHAYFPQHELVDFCKERGVTITAYAPIGTPGKKKGDDKEFKICIEDPIVLDIAKTLNKTPAQILLRYTIQRGIAVVPKSVTPSRIIENSQVFDFELSADDMERMGSIIERKRYFPMDFLPEMLKHPEFPFNIPF